ncbi:MAG: hypothetical protein ACJA0U_003294 [Salibacteraceae bacterium]|jgi:hypothetical protein
MGMKNRRLSGFYVLLYLRRADSLIERIAFVKGVQFADKFQSLLCSKTRTVLLNQLELKNPSLG